MNSKYFRLRSLASVPTLVIFALISYSSDAHAYVDPGIVGAMFQYVYVLIFGVVFIFLRDQLNISSICCKNFSRLLSLLYSNHLKINERIRAF